MTRDHKLILGGALGGIAGCVFALGLYVLAASLCCATAAVIGWAGRE